MNTGPSRIQRYLFCYSHTRQSLQRAKPSCGHCGSDCPDKRELQLQRCSNQHKRFCRGSKYPQPISLLRFNPVLMMIMVICCNNCHIVSAQNLRALSNYSSVRVIFFPSCILPRRYKLVFLIMRLLLLFLPDHTGAFQYQHWNHHYQLTLVTPPTRFHNLQQKQTDLKYGNIKSTS